MASHCQECKRAFVDEDGEPTEVKEATICVSCFLDAIRLEETAQ